MFLSTSFFAYAFDSFSIVKIYCGGMEQRYPGGVDRPWRSRSVFSSVRVFCPRRPSSSFGAGLLTPPSVDRVSPSWRGACIKPARFKSGHRKVESILPALKRPVPRPLPVALKSRDQSGSLNYDQCDGWGATPRPSPTHAGVAQLVRAAVS